MKPLSLNGWHCYHQSSDDHRYCWASSLLLLQSNQLGQIFSACFTYGWSDEWDCGVDLTCGCCSSTELIFVGLYWPWLGCQSLATRCQLSANWVPHGCVVCSCAEPSLLWCKTPESEPKIVGLFVKSEPQSVYPTLVTELQWGLKLWFVDFDYDLSLFRWGFDSLSDFVAASGF